MDRLDLARIHAARKGGRASRGSWTRGARLVLLATAAIMMLSLAACERFGLGRDPVDNGPATTPIAGKSLFDGTWTGTITWEDFTPASAPKNDGTECLSAAGLPVTVPLTLTFTTASDGTGAASGTQSGATCQIFPDGRDNFSSVWQAAPEYATGTGGPITWTSGTVEITLPGGYALLGDLLPDNTTIVGTITGALSYGELVGEWRLTRP
jgi:hypothetical protein